MTIIKLCDDRSKTFRALQDANTKELVLEETLFSSNPSTVVWKIEFYLTATTPSNGIATGFSSMLIEINQLPTNGSCSVTPISGFSSNTARQRDFGTIPAPITGLGRLRLILLCDQKGLKRFSKQPRVESPLGPGQRGRLARLLRHGFRELLDQSKLVNIDSPSFDRFEPISLSKTTFLATTYQMLVRPKSTSTKTSNYIYVSNKVLKAFLQKELV